MSDALLPPPSGDAKKASKYIDWLIELVSKDKLDVTHTDLSKFDPSALEDHYKIDLADYQVEISHSKFPNSGKDSYVILFSNLKKTVENACEKVILAYMHLDENQYADFKNAASQQVERKKRAEEEKRLNQALEPINQALENLSRDQSFQPAVS